MGAVLAALSLAIGALVIAPAAPASAGQGYWSVDDCRPDVWGYNQIGTYGTYYYWSGGYFFVGGRIMNVYQRWSYQCGVLGPPTSNANGTGPNGWKQHFDGVIYEAYSGCYKVYIRSWNYHTSSCY